MSAISSGFLSMARFAKSGAPSRKLASMMSATLRFVSGMAFAMSRWMFSPSVNSSTAALFLESLPTLTMSDAAWSSSGVMRSGFTPRITLSRYCASVSFWCSLIFAFASLTRFSPFCFGDVLFSRKSTTWRGSLERTLPRFRNAPMLGASTLFTPRFVAVPSPASMAASSSPA